MRFLSSTISHKKSLINHGNFMNHCTAVPLFLRFVALLLLLHSAYHKHNNSLLNRSRSIPSRPKIISYVPSQKKKKKTHFEGSTPQKTHIYFDFIQFPSSIKAWLMNNNSFKTQILRKIICGFYNEQSKNMKQQGGIQLAIDAVAVVYLHCTLSSLALRHVRECCLFIQCMYERLLLSWSYSKSAAGPVGSSTHKGDINNKNKNKLHTIFNSHRISFFPFSGQQANLQASNNSLVLSSIALAHIFGSKFINYAWFCSRRTSPPKAV